MQILVTGGAGYIGSHACLQLAQSGHTPITFDNFSYGHRWAVQWGPSVEGDLHDTDALVATIKQHKIDAVMHFAAFAFVGESVTKPHIYYRNNVVGTLSLLDAMRMTGVDKIVFSSTCATYGEPKQVPMREDHPQNPVNPYGATKLMIERALADYHAAYGLRSISLRYFNAAGADAGGSIGEAHHPETHLLPLALAAAAGHGPELTVFGTDYPTADGTCIRDYIHVTDLADAHVLALNKLSANDLATHFNLGNGRGFSVREVIDMVARVTGRPVPHRSGPRRPGDPPALVGDCAMARDVLGWRPKTPELETIVSTAWRWHHKAGQMPGGAKKG